VPSAAAAASGSAPQAAVVAPGCRAAGSGPAASATRPGGSVGSHLDSYDVLLLQADGLRRWAINRAGYSEVDFAEGLDLRIIEGFRAEEE
jgi:ribosomal protein L16 Arg81 hydroxylase